MHTKCLPTCVCSQITKYNVHQLYHVAIWYVVILYTSYTLSSLQVSLGKLDCLEYLHAKEILAYVHLDETSIRAQAYETWL